uniref:Integrin_alpha2 domain-containing protein n=1 Tax=Rodentolepis nana TaxID=102285 RepID=A0A158QHH8_RODNA
LADNERTTESFYCTKDSPLLNNIFGQYAEESIFIKKPHDCSKFQHACQQCFEQANTSRRLDHQRMKRFLFLLVFCDGSMEACMQIINCYNTPGCLGYFSPPCYPEDQGNNFANGTCVKGNTFKLSISPDFQNISNSFQCHLQKSKHHELYINFTIQTGLMQMRDNVSEFDFSKVQWKNHPQEFHVKINNDRINIVAGPLNVMAMLKSSNVTLDSPKEAILRGIKSIYDANEYDTKLYNLKTFQKSREPIQQEQSVGTNSQGDLQMKAVQFSRPFLHCTSNWRSSGCDMDISNIISGNEVLFGSVISSVLRINDTKGNLEPFTYVIKEDIENSLKVKIELESRTEVAPLYLNIRVAFDETLTDPLAHQDLLLFPLHVKKSTDISVQTPYEYSIQLRFPNLSTRLANTGSRQGLKKVLVTIQDCFSTQNIQLLMFASSGNIDTMMLDGADMSDLKNGAFVNLTKPTTSSMLLSIMFPEKGIIIVPYLFLFIGVLIIAVILMIVHTLTCLIQRQKRNRIHGIHIKTLHLKDSENLKFTVLSGEKPELQERGYFPLNTTSISSLFKQPDFRKQGFSCAKKGILVSYISFRVFYTFIFTFSVALSILFSFWPPVGFENNSGVNRDALLPLAQREAARREVDTEKILLQHSNKAAQLVRACQDIVIRQVVDVAREVDRAVQEILDAELNPHKSKDNMFKLMESLVFQQMADLNYSVQDYISHLLVELNNATMSDALRFSDLISRIHASQWLLFVKRMMNNSHIPWDINSRQTQFLPTPEYLNELRLKISNIEFARQFGLAEAENFIFIPMLITSQLEDLVLSRDPSKTIQPMFLISVYKELETSTQSNSDQGYNVNQDVFKPRVLRSFTNVDDLEIVSRQNQLDLKSPQSAYPNSKPSVDRKSAGKLFDLHLSPLSLGQIRLTLFLIDCYLIATRFYNTYLVLREILTDKRLVVDAASYLSVLAALPAQKHLNGDVKLDGSQYSSFHEQTHYQCGHSSTSKPDINMSLLGNLSRSVFVYCTFS